MKETLLQYAWKYKLYYAGNLMSVDGEKIEVIDPGQWNTDAGPDFFNAKVKIGNTTWAGNVEIHVHASDWYAHHHSTDMAYDNIILHVVAVHDSKIERMNGDRVEQLVLPVYPELEERYNRLVVGSNDTPCSAFLPDIPRIILHSWKATLIAEKLERKTGDIDDLLRLTHNNWEEAFYIVLARNFGTGINSVPFELMAKSLPQHLLARHKDNPTQIEALLFGQANLIPSDGNDVYTEKLKNEYAFLKAKYNLRPIDGHLWKLLRLRPQNFPHVRIAQFADLIVHSSKLFSLVLYCQTLHELEKLFRCGVSTYWQSHYLFNKPSAERDKIMGLSTIRLLLINTVIPFLFTYGRYRDDQQMQDRSLHFLEQIPPEQNQIVARWKSYSLVSMSAYDTQALIHLKKHYCDSKKCLQCRIGHQVLTKSLI